MAIDEGSLTPKIQLILLKTWTICYQQEHVYLSNTFKFQNSNLKLRTLAKYYNYTNAHNLEVSLVTVCNNCWGFVSQSAYTILLRCARKHVTKNLNTTSKYGWNNQNVDEPNDEEARQTLVFPSDSDKLHLHGEMGTDALPKTATATLELPGFGQYWCNATRTFWYWLAHIPSAHLVMQSHGEH